MLIDIAKKLPVYTRTGSGGQFIESYLEKQISKNLKKAKSHISTGSSVYLALESTTNICYVALSHIVSQIHPSIHHPLSHLIFFDTFQSIRYKYTSTYIFYHSFIGWNLHTKTCINLKYAIQYFDKCTYLCNQNFYTHYHTPKTSFMILPCQSHQPSPNNHYSPSFPP